jgi:hypothetical protein
VVLEMHGRELGMRYWDVIAEFAPVMLRVRERLDVPENEADSKHELAAAAEIRVRPDEQATAAQFTANQTWLHPYDKLFSPRYFQFSVRSGLKDWSNRRRSSAGTAENTAQPESEQEEDERQTLFPDGSVEWSPRWRLQTPQQIRVIVESDNSKPAVRPLLSANRCRFFDAFVSDLEKAGIAVEIVLVPPFPAAFDHLQKLYKEDGRPFPIPACEAYVREFTKKHRIQIDGSLDPRLAKVKDEEFIDYIHMRREGLARLIAGGDPVRSSAH